VVSVLPEIVIVAADPVPVYLIAIVEAFRNGSVNVAVLMSCAAAGVSVTESVAVGITKAAVYPLCVLIAITRAATVLTKR